MAFSKEKQGADGLSNKFGNPIAEDENSNKTGATPKRVGPISGRLKTYKTPISGLNTGVDYARDDS